MNGLDFIGKGWRFPLEVNSRGGIDMTQGPERVQQAIWIILRTSLGERLMRPRFGAGVDDLVFRPNTPAVRSELAGAIRTALLTWEPRIDLDAVRVDPVDGAPSRVLAAIDYRIRGTNELFNVVFPFYVEEGVS